MSLTSIATSLISALGYGGLGVGLVVDSAGVPIPSEVLIPLAASLVHTGRFSMVAIIAVGTIAQTLGAVLAYGLGATGGLALAERYGKYVLFSHRELAFTQRAFDRWGLGLTLVGRCVPVIRTYIGFPAGVAKMRLSVFVAASAIGSLLWTSLLAFLGYRLATPERLQQLDELFRRFSLVVAALIVVGVIWFVKRHIGTDNAAKMDTGDTGK